MKQVLLRLYDRAPRWVQNLGVTYYGWHLYRREYGRKFWQRLEEFERYQWLSPGELKNYQDEQLAGLIKHCYENVPYYRRIMDERKLRPADIQRVDDLPKLPLLTREDVKRYGPDLVAANFRPRQLILGHTSGTTGSPLEFYYDRNICLMKNVVDWRQKRWAGVDFRDRMAFFLGRMVVPLAQTKPPFWRYNLFFNQVWFSSFHLSPVNLPSYFDQLAKFEPVAIEGYPSTAYILARYLISRKTTFPVRAVFTSSETLYPQQREAIETAFCCRVFDFYGMAERVIFAGECSAHEGHHLNLDFGITELLGLNGQPVGVGEMGRIVATGLHNYGMPLVRYQTSDVTALKATPCSCGRGFPLMAEVTTKAEDIITTKDGRYISSSILTHPFKPMHNVAESQIIQENREHIVINIVKLPTYTDADSEYLLRELRKRLGDEMKLEIRFVDSIPRTTAGKFRWVISKVPLEF